MINKSYENWKNMFTHFSHLIRKCEVKIESIDGR